MPPIFYKHLNVEGALAFLKSPQIRYKDWRKLDDLMEVLPGFRQLTEEEVRIEAKGRFARLPGVSLDKHEHFLRALTSLPAEYLEEEMRKLFEAQPTTLFVCSMTSRHDSGEWIPLFGPSLESVWAIG